MHYYIQTFGCQMNENDSALIAALLNSSGYSRTDSIQLADVIVVNTCCVRHSAENRAFGFIGSLKGLKTQNPGLVIAVCGCLAQKEGAAEEFLRKARHVSILCGTFAISRLPQYIEEYRGRGETIVDVAEQAREEAPALPLKAGERGFKAQVNIIHGCDNFCSYCIVPFVRGREHSRAPQAIIEEVRALTVSGVSEIQLLGQNVNSYGKDMLDAGWDFARLLRELDQVEGLKRLRYMTSHPRDFNAQLIEVVANSRHICRHFHLPLQAGSDRILAAMNRGYDTAYYARLLADIRAFVPDATITTDLIMGFPGESETDFCETLDFVAGCRFDAAYTFLYSPRSGTPAASLPDQVSGEEKRARLKRLMDIQNPISLIRNQALLGQKQIVLVEGISKNRPDHWYGRNEGNKIVVFPYQPGMQAGSYLRVEICAAHTWHLDAIPIW